ncbi:unnamed protein product [Mytilus edulis]|uniref:Uncharacterized protein n=1 Tax=Mytilus edulis TaxID=6550 RepID=A0A8S3QB37_MYTED|nr:unnamed protein product [Mytilus edulis]
MCHQQSQSIQKNARNELATITATLIQQYIDVKYSTQELNLNDIAFRNVTMHFKHILKKMENLGYDTNLIKYLLDANSTVVLQRQKNCSAWIEREQQNKIKRLQQDLRMVEYERDKLAYFLKAGISKPVLTENEEFFMSLAAANMPMPFTRTTSVSVGKFTKLYEHIPDLIKMKHAINEQLVYLLDKQNMTCFNSYAISFRISTFDSCLNFARFVLYVETDYFFIYSTEMQGKMTEEIGIDRMKEIMFKILKTWDDTLNDKEREILIKEFLPADAQKAFKESKVPLLEFLWANHIKITTERISVSLYHGTKKGIFLYLLV